MSPLRIEQRLTTDIDSPISQAFTVADGRVAKWECLRIVGTKNGGVVEIVSDDNTSSLSSIVGFKDYRIGERIEITTNRSGEPRSRDFALIQGTGSSRLRLIAFRAQ